MTTDIPATGWVLTGFQTVLLLSAWAGAVLLYALWRSLVGPETDPIRESGPID